MEKVVKVTASNISPDDIVIAFVAYLLRKLRRTDDHKTQHHGTDWGRKEYRKFHVDAG